MNMFLIFKMFRVIALSCVRKRKKKVYRTCVSPVRSARSLAHTQIDIDRMRMIDTSYANIDIENETFRVRRRRNVGEQNMFFYSNIFTFRRTLRLESHGTTFKK